MEDNNIQDSCCNSKYASIRQMDKLDEMLGRRFPFYPRTVIQAVHDGRTARRWKRYWHSITIFMCSIRVQRDVREILFRKK